MALPPLKVGIASKPTPRPGKVTSFSMVKDEMYFMPHFLAHYRALGIKEFWFLDDRSTDGTFEYLKSQPDCGVLTANYTFGETIPGTSRPFFATCKTIVPHQLLLDRWVLTLDADEFLLLPPGIVNLDDLANTLEANGLKVARALMQDFFPPTLRALDGAPADASPFELCPLFDVWKMVDWPDGASNVASITIGDAVRPRLLAKLRELGGDIGVPMDKYRYANVNKSPLAYWDKETRAMTSHSLNISPSDRIQLVLAHFKFYPGHERRTQFQVQAAVHWQNASEYRILDAANRVLKDWPLAGPQTRKFESVADMVEAGLLYNRLPLASL